MGILECEILGSKMKIQLKKIEYVLNNNEVENLFETNIVPVVNQQNELMGVITASDLLEGDIMFHVQADVSYHDWKSVVDSARKYYDKYGFGIYSPNIDYTDITYSDFKNLKLPEDENLQFVSNTDCSAWFIHKSVIDYFKLKFKDIYLETKFGWGICFCLSAISIQLNLPIFRDYAFLLSHPKSRTYNSDRAGQLCANFYINISKIDTKISTMIKRLKIKDGRTVMKMLPNIPFIYDTSWQKRKI
jgi:hypothetical protein